MTTRRAVNLPKLAVEMIFKDFFLPSDAESLGKCWPPTGLRAAVLPPGLRCVTTEGRWSLPTELHLQL